MYMFAWRRPWTAAFVSRPRPRQIASEGGKLLSWTELLKLRRKRHQQPQIRRALEDGPSACPPGSGSVFVLGGVAQGMPPKSGLFAVVAADVKRPHGRK